MNFTSNNERFCFSEDYMKPTKSWPKPREVNCSVGSPWVTQLALDGLESSLMEEQRLKMNTRRERQNQ